MEQCGRVQAKAAQLLRLTPRQLGYALQKNRIEVRKFWLSARLAGSRR
jgi:Nif-specific regulatory protein